MANNPRVNKKSFIVKVCAKIGKAGVKMTILDYCIFEHM
jgi:hypothetical protein